MTTPKLTPKQKEVVDQNKRMKKLLKEIAKELRNTGSDEKSWIGKLETKIEKVLKTIE